jgi:hypothetical protein
MRRDWYFTFGIGDPLYQGRYIVFHGTFDEARDQMFAHFGSKWAFQYASAEAAGVQKYALELMTVEDIVAVVGRPVLLDILKEELASRGLVVRVTHVSEGDSN